MVFSRTKFAVFGTRIARIGRTLRSFRFFTVEAKRRSVFSACSAFAAYKKRVWSSFLEKTMGQDTSAGRSIVAKKVEGKP